MGLFVYWIIGLNERKGINMHIAETRKPSLQTWLFLNTETYLLDCFAVHYSKFCASVNSQFITLIKAVGVRNV